MNSINIIFKFVTDLTKNPLMLTIVPIVVTCILTYFATKKSIKNEKRDLIYQTSFETVYLPLYRKFNKIDSYDFLSDAEAKLLYLQIKNIYEKNFIYAHPIINLLLLEFKKTIDNGKNPSYVISRLHGHIIDNYKRLRKKLYYPSMSFIKSFQYLSAYYKFYVIFIILLSSFLIIIYLMSIFIYYKLNAIVINITATISIVIALLFFIALGSFLIYTFFDLIIRKIKERKHNRKVNLQK